MDHRLKSAFVFSNLVAAHGNTRLPGYYIETGSSFAVNFLYFRLRVLVFGLENSKFGQMAFVSLNSLPPELGWPLCPCSGGLGQFKYQGISRNFRQCSEYLTLAGLPSARCPSRAATQGPNSPNHLNKSLRIWAWSTQGAPVHCQVCSLIHQSWPVRCFFLDAHVNSSCIQSICFLSTFPGGVIFTLPSLGHSSQKAGPLVWSYFLNTE